MPAINFQRRFAEMIRSGTKHHTIRRKRKYPIKPGDVLKLYTGMRTKSCELIMEAPCTRVVPVMILPACELVRLDGKVLSQMETVMFASRDGFPDVYQFFEFFKQYHTDILMFDLEVIYWR
jgi:hypothetical protein